MKKINFKKYFQADWSLLPGILFMMGLALTGMIFDHFFADHPYYPDIIKTITDNPEENFLAYLVTEFEFIFFFIKGVVIWAMILSPFVLYILIEELKIYFKK